MTDVEKNIVLSYAENDMNETKTARAIHYHRNTIEYHFKKITEKYGLNPHKFYDLIKLIKMAKGGNEE